MSGFLGNIAQTILMQSQRGALGTVIPNVVVTEEHSDELTVTDHPVEQGASVTDHAFKQPATVTLRMGFSQSGVSLLGAVSALVQGGSPIGLSPQDIYAQLLTLQASRQPINVVTGKRMYSSMLVRTLSTTTTEETENALVITAGLRQIIIVQVQTTTLAPQANHAQPQTTAPTQSTGTQQPLAAGSATTAAAPQPTTGSFLSQIASGF